jgi:hypothetical protein
MRARDIKASVDIPIIPKQRNSKREIIAADSSAIPFSQQRI